MALFSVATAFSFRTEAFGNASAANGDDCTCGSAVVVGFDMAVAFGVNVISQCLFL